MKQCYECQLNGDYVVEVYNETDKHVHTIIMCDSCYQEAVTDNDNTLVIIKNLND